MNHKPSGCDDIDCSALISMILCLRGAADLSTTQFWRAVERQMSFSGFLIAGMGLVGNIREELRDLCIAGLVLGFFGCLSALWHFKACSANWKHCTNYNDSCKELEEELPGKYKEYGVVHTHEKLSETEHGVKKYGKYICGGLFGLFLVIVFLSLIGLRRLPPTCGS